MTRQLIRVHREGMHRIPPLRGQENETDSGLKIRKRNLSQKRISKKKKKKRVFAKFQVAAVKTKKKQADW